MHKRVRNVPSLVNLDVRLKMMDLFNDYAQVICIGSPPIEAFGPPPISTDMAKLTNDWMAELDRPIWLHPARGARLQTQPISCLTNMGWPRRILGHTTLLIVRRSRESRMEALMGGLLREGILSPPSNVRIVPTNEQAVKKATSEHPYYYRNVVKAKS